MNFRRLKLSGFSTLDVLMGLVIVSIMVGVVATLFSSPLFVRYGEPSVTYLQSTVVKETFDAIEEIVKKNPGRLVGGGGQGLELIPAPPAPVDVTVNSPITVGPQVSPSMVTTPGGNTRVIWVDNSVFTGFEYMRSVRGIVHTPDGTPICWDENKELSSCATSNSPHWWYTPGQTPPEVTLHNTSSGSLIPIADIQIEVLSNGNFVMVWNENDYNLFFQLYSAVGNKIGEKTQVNTRSNAHYFSIYFKEEKILKHKVAMLPNGEFVVFWSQKIYRGDSSWSTRIFGKRFNADRVAQEPSGTDATSDADSEYYSNHDDSKNVGRINGTIPTSTTVLGRNYSGHGYEFPIGPFTYHPADVYLEDVESSQTGEIIVIRKYNQNLYGLRFDSNFNKVCLNGNSGNCVNDGDPDNDTGEAFRVNTYQTEPPFSANVSFSSTGDFVISWIRKYGRVDTTCTSASCNYLTPFRFGVFSKYYTATGGAQRPSGSMATGDIQKTSFSTETCSINTTICIPSEEQGLGEGYEYRVHSDELTVPTGFTNNSQNLLDSTFLSNGEYVITWPAQLISEINLNKRHVFAKRFKYDSLGGSFQELCMDGTATGGCSNIAGHNNSPLAEFRVNTSDNGTLPANGVTIDIAPLPNSKYVITWNGAVDGGDPDGIGMRRFPVPDPGMTGWSLISQPDTAFPPNGTREVKVTFIKPVASGLPFPGAIDVNSPESDFLNFFQGFTTMKVATVVNDGFHPPVEVAMTFPILQFQQLALALQYKLSEPSGAPFLLWGSENVFPTSSNTYIIRSGGDSSPPTDWSGVGDQSGATWTYLSYRAGDDSTELDSAEFIFFNTQNPDTGITKSTGYHYFFPQTLRGKILDITARLDNLNSTNSPSLLLTRNFPSTP